MSGNIVRFFQLSMGVGVVGAVVITFLRVFDIVESNTTAFEDIIGLLFIAGVFFVVNKRVYEPYLKEVKEKGSAS